MRIEWPRTRLGGAFMRALALVCFVALPVGAQPPEAFGVAPAHRTAASQAIAAEHRAALLCGRRRAAGPVRAGGGGGAAELPSGGKRSTR
jgi:hypothetical protein